MRISDWSSDVCSSDLHPHRRRAGAVRTGGARSRAAAGREELTPGRHLPARGRAVYQESGGPVAELVDARDLKSRAFGRAGSIPAGATRSAALLRSSGSAGARSSVYGVHTSLEAMRFQSLFGPSHVGSPN